MIAIVAYQSCFNFKCQKGTQDIEDLGLVGWIVRIVGKTGVMLVQVTPEADFSKDLGLDSLDTVEVVMAFEEEFCVEIPDAEADRILSTSDAIKYISGHPQAK